MGFRFRPELLPAVVDRLKALADENRLRILMRLREGEANVTALVEQTGISQASVSKHLATLREVGLVAVARQGNQAMCRIKDESVFEICEIVCGGVVRHLRDKRATLAKSLGLQSTKRRRVNRRSLKR